MHSENVLPNTHCIVTFPKMSKILYSCGLSKGICNIHTGSKPSEQTQCILSLSDPILLCIDARANPACSLVKTGMPPICVWLLFVLMKYDKTTVCLRLICRRLFHHDIFSPNKNRGFRYLDSWAANVRNELQSWRLGSCSLILTYIRRKFSYSDWTTIWKTIQNEPSTWGTTLIRLLVNVICCLLNKIA